MRPRAPRRQRRVRETAGISFMMPPNIIIASVRRKRIGPAIAEWLAQEVNRRREMTPFGTGRRVLRASQIKELIVRPLGKWGTTR
jgi:hypothetical protein